MRIDTSRAITKFHLGDSMEGYPEEIPLVVYSDKLAPIEASLTKQNVWLLISNLKKRTIQNYRSVLAVLFLRPCW